MQPIASGPCTILDSGFCSPRSRASRASPHRVRQPCVAILTDGSGSTADSASGRFTGAARANGRRPAARFGPVTDREAYVSLMAADVTPFLAQRQLARRHAAHRQRSRRARRCGRRIQPGSRCLPLDARAAVSRARQFGAQIELFEVDLISHPDAAGDGLRLTLDDEAFRRKLTRRRELVSSRRKHRLRSTDTGRTRFASSSCAA